MSNFRAFVVKHCGKPVHPASTSCGTAGDLSDHFPANKNSLGTTLYLSDLLYYFCTHLLHSRNSHFSPVKPTLYPLSTPPTITITTNI